ncbi:MAG: hypothetical protein AAF384_11920 [Pseudomonadota bacterium]
MWGETWGSMIWGGGASPTVVPFGFWSTLILGLVLGGCIVLANRHRAARVPIAFMLLGVGMGGAALTLPHTFTNGTVADADEVNANFAALQGFPPPDYDSGWFALPGSATSSFVFNHNLGTYDFANIEVQASQSADGSHPISVAGVTSSGSASFGAFVRFPSPNTMSVTVGFSGGPWHVQTGVHPYARIRIWQ